jgi:hypothetical protein
VRFFGIILSIFFLSHGLAQAQQDTLRLIHKGALAIFMKSVQESYHQKGYLLAKVDSLAPHQVQVVPGPYYDSCKITWLEGGKSTSWYIKMQDAAQLSQTYLEQFVNTGYPFAEVKYTLLSQDSNQLHILAAANSGDFYAFDSFVFKGTQFHPKFLSAVAGIRKGEAFSEEKLKRFHERMRIVEGVRSGSSVSLGLIDDRLLVYMPQRKAGKDLISGMAGLATQANGRAVFTGEFQGRFYNMFGRGVSTGVDWRSFKARSQEFRLNTSLPYLFSLPFISTFRLEFMKFDTLFSTLYRGVEFRLPTGNGGSIIIGAALMDRITIFTDKVFIENNRRLPGNPAMRHSAYSAGYQLGNLPLGELPRKGWFAFAKGTVASRKFLKDPAIEAIQWTNAAGVLWNVYDSLDAAGAFKNNTYRVQVDAAFYQPLSSWLVLKVAGEYNLYKAPKVYFNELDRYGGIKSIRGFNEQSIFANEFYMGTLELRLMPDAESYIGPFYHVAFFRNQSELTGNALPKGWLHGLGIQSGVRTGAGILQFAWAVGKGSGQRFGFNQSKFHVGLTTAF